VWRLTGEANHGGGNWPDGQGPVRTEPGRADDDEALIVDVNGYEGPLDLLLELARSQKVDLAQISILALAEQYLSFIEQARIRRLELAADYLVMAAWLAFLKSRLLLPSTPGSDEAPAEDMAQFLAFRLQRLQAMREAAAQLMARNRLGRDVFARGAPEPLVVETTREYGDTLIDLLKAYAERRQKRIRHQTYTVKRQPVWTIKEARAKLEGLMGHMSDWEPLDRWLDQYLREPRLRPSVLASSFTASLELAREGALEIRQERAFEPIYMRRKTAA
jgi:segregation and condensation protein A